MVICHFIDHVCTLSCVITSVSGYLSRPQVSDSLVLELQDGVSCLTRLLGMKLLSLQEQTQEQQALLKFTLNSNTLLNSYIEMTNITITSVQKKGMFLNH